MVEWGTLTDDYYNHAAGVAQALNHAKFEAEVEKMVALDGGSTFN